MKVEQKMLTMLLHECKPYVPSIKWNKCEFRIEQVGRQQQLFSLAKLWLLQQRNKSVQDNNNNSRRKLQLGPALQKISWRRENRKNKLSLTQLPNRNSRSM